LASADPTGAFLLRRRSQLLPESREPVLQRDSSELRRVGVELAQLLNLLLDGQVVFWACPLLLFA
jgi:hypothetical protein